MGRLLWPPKGPEQGGIRVNDQPPPPSRGSVPPQRGADRSKPSANKDTTKRHSTKSMDRHTVPPPVVVRKPPRQTNSDGAKPKRTWPSQFQQ